MGCSSPSNQKPGSDPKKPDEKKKDEPPLDIVSNDVKVVHRDDKNVIVMVARAKASTTSVDRDSGDTKAELIEPAGELYEDGNVASHFESPKGTIIDPKTVLSLTGGVTVTSEMYDIVLTADKVVWHKDSRIIEAVGNVWIKGPSFNSGPSPKLVTTPKLQRIGTPDRFTK